MEKEKEKEFIHNKNMKNIQVLGDTTRQKKKHINEKYLGNRHHWWGTPPGKNVGLNIQYTYNAAKQEREIER